MKGRVLSRADAVLIAALPEGCKVTPRQLERWRQKGVIPETGITRLGSEGTSSHYPEGTAAQVVELVGILKEDRRLDHALLRLFIRRYPVSEKALKSLYLMMFAAFGGEADSRLRNAEQDEAETDALDVAEDMATQFVPRFSRHGLARTIRLRLRKRATDKLPVGELVRSVFAQVVLGFLSGELYEDYEGLLVAELKTASGIAAAEKDVILGDGPLLPKISDGETIEAFTAVDYRSLISSVARATLAELAKARDHWVHIARLVADVGEVASSAARRRDAGGLALVRKVAGDEILLALFVPYWLVARKLLDMRGVEIDPLWDPSTARGREYAELYRLLAQLARCSPGPLREDTLAAALSSAPEDIRQAFEKWSERGDERTVLV